MFAMAGRPGDLTEVFISGPTSQYIKLNVGGYLFYTTIGTLTKQDGMLRAMFSGRMGVTKDKEGWVLIDQDGKQFEMILQYLRDGEIILPDDRPKLEALKTQATFYLLQELKEVCEKAIEDIVSREEPEAKCRVTLITSSREEQSLVQTSFKPLVKLCCNRHNNKYSYTNQSDDNFLHNIELFDKLSLRFGDRILFVKDVIGSNEICCWSFFGHKQKVAEVCCTSIVYGQDKKATKVEFPEARIYEETLNVLLYEDRQGPDKELVAATRGFTVGSSATTTLSDEEDEPASRRRNARR